MTDTPCCRGGDDCPNRGCFVPDVLYICQRCNRGMKWHCCHYCCPPCERRLEDEAHAINDTINDMTRSGQ